MKQAQRKDFFREIRRSLNRYLSILFIVALGVAFFSGIRAAEPDMRLSADAVADQANFMDLRILSTMGLTGADLEAIRAVDGISQAEGEQSVEVLTQCGEKELVIHVATLMTQLNYVTIDEGRLPEKEGECFLDNQLCIAGDYQVGDRITLKSGTKDPLSDTLNHETYTIVGIGSSPYYLNFDKGSSTIGNGDIRGFVMVLPEEFKSDIYTQIYATCDSLKPYITASDAYFSAADQIKAQVEDIAGERCEVRLSEVRKEAQDKIDDGQRKLDDSRAEAEEKLADAETQITDGEQALQDGRELIAENEQKLADGRAELQASEKTLEDGKAELAKQEQELSGAKNTLAEKEQELRNGKAALEDGKAALAEQEQKLENGKTEIRNARAGLQEQEAVLEDGEASLALAKSQYENGAAEIQEGWQALEAAKTELAKNQAALASMREALLAAGIDPETNPEYQAAQSAVLAAEEQIRAQEAALSAQEAELSEMKELLDEKETELLAGRQELESGKAELDHQEAALQAAEVQLNSGKSELLEKEAQLKQGEEALAAARSELEAGENQLAEAKAKLEEGENQLQSAKAQIADGEAQLLDAKQELAENEETLNDARADYAEAKADAEQQLSDGEQELDDARAELDKLKLPEWYVLGRDTVQSYVEYDSDADRIGAIGKVFPVIFFLVAALVSLTTMTRMVEEKRTEIGTMKALGYSTLSIAAKYLGYAVSASVLGSVLGFLVGEKLLPWVIITSYKILYVNLTIIRVPYNWGYALGASAIAVLCTGGATLAACYRAALSQPAELMRPAAPLQGKKILLERIRPIWKHLNFSQKSTLRNLFRYKKRFLMTVFGIGACMALLIVGFGLRDSIYAVSESQYGELWRYDVVAGIDADCGDVDREKLDQTLSETDNVDEVLTAHTATLDAEANGVTKEINLVVPKEIGEFPDFFVLRDRISKQVYELDDEGAAINEKLAKFLDLQVGDSFRLKESDTESVTVTVSHIVENYVYNYVYLSPTLYEKLYGAEPQYDKEYIRLHENGKEPEQRLAELLLEEPAVSGVTLVTDMNQTILDMLESLDSVIGVLITSAGLLAFVVVYNLNNINITERRRELATIRLLGFYDMELAAYVYRENVLLTAIGIVVGIFMGNLLHRFVIKTVEVDLIMFGRVVHPISYVYCAALTVLFALLVNVFMYFKLRKIDMVESLKSVE